MNTSAVFVCKKVTEYLTEVASSDKPFSENVSVSVNTAPRKDIKTMQTVSLIVIPKSRTIKRFDRLMREITVAVDVYANTQLPKTSNQADVNNRIEELDALMCDIAEALLARVPDGLVGGKIASVATASGNYGDTPYKMAEVSASLAFVSYATVEYLFVDIPQRR